MHGNGFTNYLATSPTSSVVSFDSGGSSAQPTLTPVCRYATNPLRRVFSRKILSHVLRVAIFRTEAKTRFCFVLSRDPRLNVKLLSTLSTFVSFALNKIHCSDLFAGKCVGGAESCSPLVSVLVIVRHVANGHMPLAAAFKAAKARFFRSVFFNLEWYATNLTRFCYHSSIIPQFMGGGTTGAASVLGGFNFVGIELNGDYFKIAAKRIGETAQQLPLAFRAQRELATIQADIFTEKVSPVYA